MQKWDKLKMETKNSKLEKINVQKIWKIKNAKMGKFENGVKNSKLDKIGKNPKSKKFKMRTFENGWKRIKNWIKLEKNSKN